MNIKVIQTGSNSRVCLVVFSSIPSLKQICSQVYRHMTIKHVFHKIMSAGFSPLNDSSNNNNNNNNDNNNNNNNNHHHHHLIFIIIIVIALKGANQDFFTISSLCCQLSSGGLGVIVCKSCAAHRALITCHMVPRDGSAIKLGRVEIAPILALFYWLNH